VRDDKSFAGIDALEGIHRSAEGWVRGVWTVERQTFRFRPLFGLSLRGNSMMVSAADVAVLHRARAGPGHSADRDTKPERVSRAKLDPSLIMAGLVPRMSSCIW